MGCWRRASRTSVSRGGHPIRSGFGFARLKTSSMSSSELEVIVVRGLRSVGHQVSQSGPRHQRQIMRRAIDRLRLGATDGHRRKRSRGRVGSSAWRARTVYRRQPQNASETSRSPAPKIQPSSTCTPRALLPRASPSPRAAGCRARSARATRGTPERRRGGSRRPSDSNGVADQAIGRFANVRGRDAAERHPRVRVELLDWTSTFLTTGDAASRFLDHFGEGEIVLQGWKLASNLGQQSSQRSLDALCERLPVAVQQPERAHVLHDTSRSALEGGSAASSRPVTAV